MIVNRGPQLVQLMNGYRYRRSAGSASSDRQSAQVAVSAGTRARRGPPGSLGTMAKLAAPSGASGRAVTRSTLASGGASRSSERRNSLTASGAPSTSAKTPSTSLPTRPPRPRRVASAYTNGRKPTPWTIPSTRTAVLMRWLTLPVWLTPAAPIRTTGPGWARPGSYERSRSRPAGARGAGGTGRFRLPWAGQGRRPGGGGKRGPSVSPGNAISSRGSGRPPRRCRHPAGGTGPGRADVDPVLQLATISRARLTGAPRTGRPRVPGHPWCREP